MSIKKKHIQLKQLTHTHIHTQDPGPLTFYEFRCDTKASQVNLKP